MHLTGRVELKLIYQGGELDLSKDQFKTGFSTVLQMELFTQEILPVLLY